MKIRLLRADMEVASGGPGISPSAGRQRPLFFDLWHSPFLAFIW